MRNKYLYVTIILFLVISNIQYAQTKDLNKLISTAIKVSPTIKMLIAKKQAAKNKIPQFSNLPDPMLTLGFRNMPTSSFSFSEDPMSQKTIGITQSFPFPGRLSAKEDVAAIDTSIINQEIKDSENEIRKLVSKAYYNLIYYRRAIFYAKESRKLLIDIKDVVGVNIPYPLLLSRI